MEIVLPLNEMTTAEKLAVIERLWDDLARNPQDVPSPDWHGEELSQRLRRAQAGESPFSEIQDVRERLRKAAP
jgi:putative addiction module component (TIGR02574 family)